LLSAARERARVDMETCPSTDVERLVAAKRRMEGVEYVRRTLQDLIKNRLNSPEL
jgi:hypothetical protein